MKKLLMIMAGLLALLVASASSAWAGTVVYNNIPNTLADNYPSLGYQATQTGEFGDRVTLGPGGRDLDSVTVTLSSWAHSEDYGNATSWAQALTLNVYDGGSGNLPGSLLGSLTDTFNILFRPFGWSANGIAQNVRFDFSGMGITLPETVVIGLAFNTQSYGLNPTGVDGPYNSLNFALQTVAGGGITVGSNPDLDDLFWKTATAAWYTDGGAGGVNVFRQDTRWTPYVPMIAINTDGAVVPLPSSAWMGLSLLGGLGLVSLRRRRSKNALNA